MVTKKKKIIKYLQQFKGCKNYDKAFIWLFRPIDLKK